MKSNKIDDVDKALEYVIGQLQSIELAINAVMYDMEAGGREESERYEELSEQLDEVLGSIAEVDAIRFDLDEEELHRRLRRPIEVDKQGTVYAADAMRWSKSALREVGRAIGKESDVYDDVQEMMDALGELKIKRVRI